MSAETLRRAAALMRSNAEGAADAHGTWFTPQFLAESTNDIVTIADGVHIASWRPPVALAVAAWLDRTARVVDTAPERYQPTAERLYAEAFAVAHTYLGEIESFRPERGAE